MTIYWPILLVIGIIAGAIAIARMYGATWSDVLGVAGGLIGIFAAHVYNKFIYIWNIIAAVANFVGNVFRNPVAAVKALFYDMAVNVLGYIETLAKGIQDLLNKIPGVEINMVGKITSIKNSLAAKSEKVKSEADLIEFVKSKDFIQYSNAYKKGSNTGKNLATGFGDTISKVMSGLKNTSGIKFGAEPVTIKGTGSGGKVKVDMSDEDLKYLREISSRDYVSKMNNTTLAPKVTFNFGDIHETADVNRIKGTLEKMMREEIATAPVGD
jgi:hypothetical protein